jgi:hypothetical protein
LWFFREQQQGLPSKKRQAVTPMRHAEELAERVGFEPTIPFQVCRFSSSQVGSEPFGKFSTLFAFSTGYNASVLIGFDRECSVMSMELLQFYYSRVPGFRESFCKQNAK